MQLSRFLVPAAFTAVLLAPTHSPAPTTALSTDISELFDPAAMARSACGRDRAPSWLNAAFANTPAPQPPLSKRRWDGLSSLTYKITTTSAEAQAFFDQGLRLVYAFNPGEAIASFRAGSAADPNCAMCFWGEALALGSNLNANMLAENIPPALAAMKKAQALATQTAPHEQSLIAALTTRYSDDKNIKHEALDYAYANAMQKIYADYKRDPEIASLMAAAVMNIRENPWGRWWDRTGQHPSSSMAAAIAALEDTLARYPEHPGAIHFYIHALDGSAWAKKAEPYADKLTALTPGAGHMVHMPAHTLFGLGRYKDALQANVAAIAIDEKYLADPDAAANGVYRYGLFPRNIHFGIAAAEMAGDATSAFYLTDKMRTFFGKDEPNARRQGYSAAITHTVVAFGSPEDILALPKPPAKLPYLVGIAHYARGTAYVRLGDLQRALREADVIAKLRSERNEKAFDGGYSYMAPVLALAEHVLRARAAAAEKKWDSAIEHLESAAALQDEMTNKDPPVWVFPVRQALGVALFRAGKPEYAIETLRQALLDAPNSGYALYALKEFSARIGDTVAAHEYGRLYENAWLGSAPPQLDRL